MESDRTAEHTSAADEAPERISVQELQRHTSEVLERVASGESGQILITKHGHVVARILPPDPAEEQTNAAIAAGILDPRALTQPYSNRQMLLDFPPESRSVGGASLSDALTALREDEGER
ncbi:type II toxin-antitoxin system prevent-host-death family antitoxin [Glycomyces sp. NPDC046736]|uniref:type II toxin-antitoxin system Phd/YefM family antitoxin n=1 Tax=Glycomyces sp. NPDC046736 TaxID=3155615 RepID=UPI0033F7BE0F